MHENLRNQLDSLGDKLPVVPTKHYVMFDKTAAGPVAFLLERIDSDKPVMRVQMTVNPQFADKIVPLRKKKSFCAVGKRKRYAFWFKDHKRPVSMAVPATGKPQCSMWRLIADDAFYEKLKRHDSMAWEDVLGEILDVPSSRSCRGRSGSSGKE